MLYSVLNNFANGEQCQGLAGLPLVGRKSVLVSQKGTIINFNDGAVVSSAHFMTYFLPVVIYPHDIAFIEMC